MFKIQELLVFLKMFNILNILKIFLITNSKTLNLGILRRITY